MPNLCLLLCWKWQNTTTLWKYFESAEQKQKLATCHLKSFTQIMHTNTHTHTQMTMSVLKCLLLYHSAGSVWLEFTQWCIIYLLCSIYKYSTCLWAWMARDVLVKMLFLCCVFTEFELIVASQVHVFCVALRIMQSLSSLQAHCTQLLLNTGMFYSNS